MLLLLLLMSAGRGRTAPSTGFGAAISDVDGGRAVTELFNCSGNKDKALHGN